jgi:HAD superfamily hydrolase (TIGR01459 family)
MQLAHRHIIELLEIYDVLLFDLWGVIVEGDITYPGVADRINQIISQKKVYFVSNAPRPDYKLLPKLLSFGLENITKDMIISSGDVARRVITEHKISLPSDQIKIFHLGNDRNNDILDKFDHVAVDDIKAADLLLLSLYRDEGEDLKEFDELLKNAAKQGITTVCSNPDTTIPHNGSIRYCAGHFARIVENHGGNVIYTGKPHAEIYEAVFAREPNIPKHRILMIGDTFDTDILGAQNSGIHSALVLTGNATRHHSKYEHLDKKLAALKDKADELGIYPTYVTSIA